MKSLYEVQLFHIIQFAFILLNLTGDFLITTNFYVIQL